MSKGRMHYASPLYFHDEVAFIEPFILNDDSPVRVVATERGRNFNTIPAV